MKYLFVLSLLTMAASAGCSTTSNNANMRGTNTNTGYATNTETNAKPAMPANVTNISPDAAVPSSAPSANRGSNGYVVNANNSNTGARKSANANSK